MALVPGVPKPVKRRPGKKAAIAKAAGVSQSLITHKFQQGKLVEKDGELDVEASVAAILNQATAAIDGVSESYGEAQRRKEVALADLRELELAQKSGDLVGMAFACGFLAEAAKAVTNQLLSVPDKLASLLAASSDVRECRDLVLNEIREVLTNLPSEIPVPKVS